MLSSALKQVSAVSVVIALALMHGSTQAAKPPTKVGQCSNTFVARVATRLVDENNLPAPGSGTSIVLTNGIYLVSYDTVVAAEASKPGHKVKLCIDSLPQDCPLGDDRGKIYSVTNYMTGGRFTLPDSQHFCGGA